jgi:hypothetical protein
MAEVSRVGVSGPLEPFVAGFVAELSRQGFQPVTVGKQVGLLAGLSGWLAAEGVAASGLSSEVAERFCAARRAAGHGSRVMLRALGPLLGCLRGLGVAPPASGPACAGPVEELLSSFRRYLEQERGLVPVAARGYVDKVRPFVARFDGLDGLELWRVDVVEVRGFVVEVCPRLGRRAAHRDRHHRDRALARTRTSRNHADVPPRRPRAQRPSTGLHYATGQQTRPLQPPRRTPRVPWMDSAEVADDQDLVRGLVRAGIGGSSSNSTFGVVGRLVALPATSGSVATRGSSAAFVVARIWGARWCPHVSGPYQCCGITAGRAELQSSAVS